MKQLIKPEFFFFILLMNIEFEIVADEPKLIENSENGWNPISEEIIKNFPRINISKV